MVGFEGDAGLLHLSNAVFFAVFPIMSSDHIRRAYRLRAAI
ncbi:MAG: hypothetical protein ACI9DC_001282 [Gammaproteobacteria bacterium]|jgi:hypothetical protein